MQVKDTALEYINPLPTNALQSSICVSFNVQSYVRMEFSQALRVYILNAVCVCGYLGMQCWDAVL